MGFKQHISRTWQMIEQQVNDVPFRPDDEAIRLIKALVHKGFSGVQKPKAGTLPKNLPILLIKKTRYSYG